MIKLLLDQGLPRSAAALLRDAGWDVQHVSERGLSQASDAHIMELARQEARAEVTLDVDSRCNANSRSRSKTPGQ